MTTFESVIIALAGSAILAVIITIILILAVQIHRAYGEDEIDITEQDDEQE